MFKFIKMLTHYYNGWSTNIIKILNNFDCFWAKYWTKKFTILSSIWFTKLALNIFFSHNGLPLLSIFNYNVIHLYERLVQIYAAGYATKKMGPQKKCFPLHNELILKYCLKFYKVLKHLLSYWFVYLQF